MIVSFNNISPVTSPLYTKNILEREAFDVAAMYIKGIQV